jgi:IstB-like ATP binding protein
VIHTLATCDWVKKGLPLCLIGDSGTGKSHLLIALGTEAAMAGYRVKYTLATKLVNELVEASDDMVLTKTIARYGRVDLLCIDELGYMELDRRGAELLFQVLTEREEKASVAIASNEASAAGPRPSPTRGCAPRSSTGSPSAATSSKPAPTPTASPTARPRTTTPPRPTAQSAPMSPNAKPSKPEVLDQNRHRTRAMAKADNNTA